MTEDTLGVLGLPPRHALAQLVRAHPTGVQFGCVRVERPFELAEALMDNPELNSDLYRRLFG